jgi:hypothetical protein
MFLKTAKFVVMAVLYAGLFLFPLAIGWSFLWFVFEAPVTGFAVGALAGAFCCWFMRGVLRNIDEL